jgi:hypothetical protein
MELSAIKFNLPVTLKTDKNFLGYIVGIIVDTAPPITTYSVCVSVSRPSQQPYRRSQHINLALCQIEGAYG